MKRKIIEKSTKQAAATIPRMALITKNKMLTIN